MHAGPKRLDDAAFLGDTGFTFRPTAIVDVTLRRGFTVAANVGYLLRTRTIVLDPADVVSPATAEAMAAAIRNVRERMSRSELESRKVERRSRIVRDFSLDHAIERYHALYRSLAARQPA